MKTLWAVNRIHRRTVICAGAACLLGASARAAAPEDGSWHDARRDRTVPWRLRLPTTAAPWPLVLYSHGLGGNREGGAIWSEAWTAAGAAVLHLQHPGSDTETLLGGLPALRRAAAGEQLVARALEVRFALDEVARQASIGAGPWRDLRLDAVGLAGHSFGAHTAQAVAGQRYAVHADLADARPRAFVALSPSLPREGGLSPQQSFGAIARPFLAVTGSLDGDPFGSYDSGEPRAQVYQGLPKGKRALLWLHGADHMTFAGGTARRAPSVGPFRRRGQAAQHEPVHQAAVARITAWWWRAHLLGDAQARLVLQSPQTLAEGDRFELG